ncbi:MAG: membrane protein insertase YidC [Candidatus Kerfeldbacteria bacterium]|nr:membrane protein insertase YidC [Candidatus Kerfeldbacteria bacterium]
MAQLWQTLFYQPLFNLLVLVYGWVGDMGVAIIILTILLKLILYPLSRQSLKSQLALQKLQPQVNELKKRYQEDKPKLSREMMALYQQEKISPFSSCLPLLIQLPFLIALYQVFLSGLESGSLNLLYGFINNPGHLNSSFLGVWLLNKPNWLLAIITGATQFWQTKMLLPKGSGPAAAGDMAASMNKQMLYLMPILTVIFGLRLPAGLMLYWLVNTLLTIGQQYLTIKSHAN